MVVRHHFLNSHVERELLEKHRNFIPVDSTRQTDWQTDGRLNKLAREVPLPRV